MPQSAQHARGHSGSLSGCSSPSRSHAADRRHRRTPTLRADQRQARGPGRAKEKPTHTPRKRSTDQCNPHANASNHGKGNNQEPSHEKKKKKKKKKTKKREADEPRDTHLK
eukprot:GHVT01066163.1.p2 GENE.GHVT01066163.1~~GHVT01066163.1.p2  ORF type:complete len:111 (-),score=19.41 GHVT01066163.1:434-766(-)